MLGEIVHKDVVSFLRVGPQVEDLRNGSDIFFRAVPSKVAVHCHGAGGLAVVTAKVEDRLESAYASDAWSKLVFSEIEPAIPRRFACSEQDWSHVCWWCQLPSGRSFRQVCSDREQSYPWARNASWLASLSGGGNRAPIVSGPPGDGTDLLVKIFDLTQASPVGEWEQN
jgi:hypothetical protein